MAWNGGIGGQALTKDICNECWGTGSIVNKGIDLKENIKTKQSNKKPINGGFSGSGDCV